MIYSILNKLVSILNDRIRLKFSLKQNLVKIQPIDNETSEGYISVSIINIERDTSGGITFNRKNADYNSTSKSAPTWQVNVYLLIAVVFPKKKYEESTKLITEVLQVLQSNHILSFPENGLKLTLEPLHITFQELSNIWSISGGSYHPSIICKIKSINVNSGEIMQIDSNIVDREINL